MKGKQEWNRRRGSFGKRFNDGMRVVAEEIAWLLSLPNVTGRKFAGAALGNNRHPIHTVRIEQVARAHVKVRVYFEPRRYLIILLKSQYPKALSLAIKKKRDGPPKRRRTKEASGAFLAALNQLRQLPGVIDISLSALQLHKHQYPLGHLEWLERHRVCRVYDSGGYRDVSLVGPTTPLKFVELSQR